LQAAAAKLTPIDLALAEYRANAAHVALLQGRKSDVLTLLNLAIPEMEKQLPAGDETLVKARESLKQVMQ